MLRELMQNGVNMGDVKSVPHILRTTLIAPYVDGIAFVHTLRKKGSWPMVDRAWGRPPTTTEQVLHVDKWESGEKAIEIAAPTAATLGTGWKMEDEDTFGELGFALTFEEWMESKAARLAAAGWGGDRSAVFVKGDEIALAVHVRYDAGTPRGDALAERAMQKLSAALKKTGKAATEAAGAICIERKELGPLHVARKDRDLVLIAGPARAGATWASTSTCATAKKWGDEVLAMR
jgi:hypothetical protein